MTQECFAGPPWRDAQRDSQDRMDIDTGVSSRSWSDSARLGGADAGSAAVPTGVGADLGAANMEQPVHAQRGGVAA